MGILKLIKVPEFNVLSIISSELNALNLFLMFCKPMPSFLVLKSNPFPSSSTETIILLLSKITLISTSVAFAFFTIFVNISLKFLYIYMLTFFYFFFLNRLSGKTLKLYLIFAGSRMFSHNFSILLYILLSIISGVTRLWLILLTS